jgi:hypothetical protein
MEKQVEYQLLWEDVGKLMDRRQNVSTIYLSVNAAIVAAISFLIKDVPMVAWIQQAALLLMLISGIVVCDLWRRLLIQYNILSNWWYERLRELEDTMPENSKLVTREYQDLYLVGKGKIRIGLTRYETNLTWLFTILYLAFALATLFFMFV